LDRLVVPILDAVGTLDVVAPRAIIGGLVALDLLRGCSRRGAPYWAWSSHDWVAEIGGGCKDASLRYHGARRQAATCIAYLLCAFTDFDSLGLAERLLIARKVFGQASLQTSLSVADQVLGSWGYSPTAKVHVHRAVVDGCLLNGSALLADLSLPILEELRGEPHHVEKRRSTHLLHRVLHALDVVPPPPVSTKPWAVVGVNPTWTAWVERWASTSTSQRSTRRHIRSICIQAGRWLAVNHPTICEPSAWTRELCAEWVAFVNRMLLGDLADRQVNGEGLPLSASGKSAYIGAVRTFFRDCQGWEWIDCRFDPGRALATPRSLLNDIGPRPRVIDDAIWAKLLWAGLNLTTDDLPPGGRYPIELWRALALAWLFSGSRSNEIVRLRVGCVRWQASESGEPVCLLDIPITKTSTALTRPVDPILGRALEAWQERRPVQPQLIDSRTGERADLLFALRAQRVGLAYINIRLIPALCRKAGVPRDDVRGRITSHRARSTIASHLYNAKEPMSISELQQWLGHRSPRSTQYYAELTPTTLAKAYSDAGYFSRNLRTIEVLIDREAVETGAAAAGEPWRYFDLGHGFCTYSFFEQCPHRMACARCEFYRPKASAKGLLLEGRSNLERLLKEVPLTDEERAAVDEGSDALAALLERLADVPTPAGPTPRDLDFKLSRQLPLVPVEKSSRVADR